MTANSVALFDRSAGYATRALSAVTGLDQPTPCPGWNVRKLVLHLADSADALAGLVATGKLSMPTSPREDDTDPVAVALEQTDSLLDALRSASNPAWASDAAHGGAIEFAAHGWDIATACGAEREMPDGLGAELLELAASLIDDQARAPMFGRRVAAPPGASPTDRFIAFLGREPQS